MRTRACQRLIRGRRPAARADAVTTRLTLICHAATAATRAARFPLDEPCDAAGFAPSPALAAAVARAGRRLAAPEARARETAAAFGLAFSEDGGLRDQDVGRWAGRSLAAIAAAEPEALCAWMADPAAAPHGGESLAQTVARVEAWMREQAAAGGRVAGVTHPALVRAAVAAALGAGAGAFWRVEAAPLAAATFSHDGRRWALIGLSPGRAAPRLIRDRGSPPRRSAAP